MNTEQAATQIINSLRTANLRGLNPFIQGLQKVDNELYNQLKMLQQVTQGWGAQSAKWKQARRIILERLATAYKKLGEAQGDSLEILMRTATSFKNLRMVIGEFVVTAMAPLATAVSKFNEKSFMRLYEVLSDTSGKFKDLKGGVVDLIKVVGGALGTLAALWGSFKILGLFLGTAGISMGGFAGAIMLAALAFSKVRDKSKSWMDVLSKIGTELKVYYEAFTSYSDGWITLSGDTAARFRQMDDPVRQRIWFMVKLLGAAKEALMGFGEGFMFIFDSMKKALSWFGLWNEKTKQLSSTFASIAKWTGRIGGMLAAVYGIRLAAGAIGGGLSRIPIVGRMFGGGRRGESPLKPMYVVDVGGGLGMGRGLVGRAGRGLLSRTAAGVGWMGRGIGRGLRGIGGLAKEGFARGAAWAAGRRMFAGAGISGMGHNIMVGMRRYMPNFMRMGGAAGRGIGRAGRWLGAGAMGMGRGAWGRGARLAARGGRFAGMAGRGLIMAGPAVAGFMKTAITALLPYLPVILAAVLTFAAAYMITSKILKGLGYTGEWGAKLAGIMGADKAGERKSIVGMMKGVKYEGVGEATKKKFEAAMLKQHQMAKPTVDMDKLEWLTKDQTITLEDIKKIQESLKEDIIDTENRKKTAKPK
jgi:hypothetical protein